MTEISNDRQKLKDFSLVLKYVEEHLGFTLPETNYRHVKNYLTEQLQTVNIPLKEYLRNLDTDKKERDSFFEAATIKETYFFREQKQFGVLLNHIFPLLGKKEKPLKIWSTACATGEEALSLYFSALSFFRDDKRFTVYASDICERALDSFRTGRFGKKSFRDDGKKYSDLITDFAEKEDRSWIIPPEITEKIRIFPYNLNSTLPIPDSGGFDLVFLRNVLIYFDFEKRLEIVDRISRSLCRNGFLFLSVTETPLVSHHDLILQEYNDTYYFMKKDPVEVNRKYFPSGRLMETVYAEEDRIRHSEHVSVPVDYEKVIEHANSKIFNRLYNHEENEYKTALQVLDIIYRINNNRSAEAEALISELDRMNRNHPLIDYLSGCCYLAGNRFEEALSCFDRTLINAPLFWPARYQRAFLYLRREKRGKALSDFSQCAIDINEYINRDQYRYHFLLDGFNGKYFAVICRKWADKLENEGSSHGRK